MDPQEEEPDERTPVQHHYHPEHHHNYWHRSRRRYTRFLMHLSPQQNIFYGFFIYTALGCLLLCLPFSLKVPVGVLDNLFTATSAISTTGLATVSVADSYTFLGQLIILLLIQAGGIGYMTLTSFILLAGKEKFTHWHEKVLNVEFTLPKDLEMRDFVKSVVVFTAVTELIGTGVIFFFFRQEGMAMWPALWSAVFHSISAFCTAGFSLMNTSFEGYVDHIGLNVTISLLSIFGALGFIVVLDLWNRAKGCTKKLTFTTKVIFLVYVLMQTLGTLLIFFAEPSIANESIGQRLMTAFFQSMTAITTVGFNTVPIGALTVPILLGITFMMYVGASPSGTGGGMKGTTLAAIASLMYSRIRGLRRVMLLGKALTIDRLYVATSSFIFYTALIFLGTFLLSFSEPIPLLQILFEAVSAIGTVGLSTGITGSLTPWGKGVIIVLMFIGRLGVITFGLAVLARKRNATEQLEQNEDLAV
jgi:trk system potassium uptake protein TrkH